MNKAIALANNDVVFVAWKYDRALPNCLGFSLHRIDQQTSQETPLPAWVGFKGDKNPNWQPKDTDVWPVQKFSWKDLKAKHGASYQYRVIPMVWKAGKLQPDLANAALTNLVQLSPKHGSVSAYFNRGILSTQALAHQLPKGPSGVPNYQKLQDRIDQPGDPLRNRLAGDLRTALPTLLERAKSAGGECYCALYELNDPELLQALIGAPYAHVILSDAGDDDSTNAGARQTLHESGTDVTDRMLGSGHIGHNKFVVYVDPQGAPQAVLTGSTNWTYTALCAQSNNALLIEDPNVAAAYLDFWKRLKQDGEEQAATLRTFNRSNPASSSQAGAEVWFSPNTPQKTKPSKNAKRPVDMDEVFQVILGAEQAILFLLFQPGTPSIVDAASQAQQTKPKLFVRGAATDPGVAASFTQLFHRSASDKPDVLKVVAAAAVHDQFSFWMKELLKSSPKAHAIIHDKIVVVDPLSPKCAVITGSHNLGYRASYNNDENMVILRGNQSLARAYATHVMDIYDHYRWRWILHKDGKPAWSSLKETPDWQNKYFQPGAARQELEFWMKA